MDFVFLDFETLSNIAPDAPVISMGAIAGNWNKDELKTLKETGFYRSISPLRQISEYGAKPCKDTLAWWSKQGHDAQTVLNAKDAIEIEQCLDDFTSWCLERGVTRDTQIFIRASHFDWCIYEKWMRITGRGIFWPLSHWNVREVRTLCDVIYNTKRGYAPNAKELFSQYDLVEHNALDDCLKDWLQVKIWFEQ